MVPPFVDKICPNVDFICIYADIFVTLQYKINVISMVELSVPVPICDIPERVHGVDATFQVLYADGRDCGYRGRIGSVSMLFDSLVARLSRDLSILYVGVYLPSGRCLCECVRH